MLEVSVGARGCDRDPRAMLSLWVSWVTAEVGGCPAIVLCDLIWAEPPSGLGWVGECVLTRSAQPWPQSKELSALWENAAQRLKCPFRGRG